MSQTLCFQSTQFEVVQRNQQPWVRSPQIAEALGYGQENRISDLYQRHADEFTDSMTALVTLPTEGGPQETRIFSLRGCHLLAMFARTPVARAFRKWVLDVLDRLHAEQAQPAVTGTPSTAATRAPLRSLVAAWAQISGLPHQALWPQVKAHFQLSTLKDLPEEWLPDAIAFVQGKIDAYPQKALPPAQENLPIYRDGMFYLPHRNKKHKAGPVEQALNNLRWDFDHRTAALQKEFDTLWNEIDRAPGELYSIALSHLGSKADTCFPTDAFLEMCYLTHYRARDRFEGALSDMRHYVRVSHSIAIMLGL